jgi:ankyrin repeat protein
MDVNARESGDNTYAMHWAAAAGHLEVVRRLADAGGDVVGSGDDHGLEVIGWATCWHPGQEAVADFLLSRGARHHIFWAIAMSLEEEVRRIVREDPGALSRRMSRNENHQLPLHFAVRLGRARMVALLMELGADPLGVDGSGHPAAAYATTLDVDRPVMEAIHAMAAAEFVSATRGRRPPRARALDLAAALALRDWDTAERLLVALPHLVRSGGRREAPTGLLHIAAKRGDRAAAEWLLGHRADPNGRWSHWGAEVTPLHLAAAHGHTETVRVLLAAGADPAIRDSTHASDPAGWAEHFGQPDVAEMLRTD